MGISAQQLVQSDPEFLQRQLAQQEVQRLNPQNTAAGAIGAVLGRGIGNVSAGRGFFDINDAGLRRVADVQRIMSQTEFDPNNPAGYYENIAKSLQQSGYGDLAPMALQQSLQLRRDQERADIDRQRLGFDKRRLAIEEARLKDAQYKDNPELLIEEARSLPEDDPRKQTLTNRYYDIKQAQQMQINESYAKIQKDMATAAALRYRALSDSAPTQQTLNNNGIPMGRVDSKGIFYDNAGRRIGEKAFIEAETSHNTAQDLLTSLNQLSAKDIDTAYGSLADYTQSDTAKLLGSTFSSDTQKAQYKVNQIGVKTILENLQKLKGASTDKEMQKVSSTFPGFQAKPEVMKAWVDNAIETTNKFLRRSEKQYGFDTVYEQENRFGTKKPTQPSANEVPTAGQGLPPGVSVRKVN